VTVTFHGKAAKRRGIYTGAGGALARAVDAVVGTFAPQTAHRMRAARMKNEALLAYEAVRIGRLNPGQKSAAADAEILPDLEKLRAESRALVRDDSHASSAIDILDEAIVGDGIRAQSAATAKATGMTEEQAAEWRAACDAEWECWATEYADVAGTGTFYDVQSLALRSLVVDGEFFAHAVVRRDGSYAVEIVDCDRIVSPQGIDTDKIRGGVEIDDEGRHARYWILLTHPSDVQWNTRWQLEPTPYAKMDGPVQVVMHGYRRKRAAQTRGVPWLAPGIEYLRNLHHYLGSELIAARAASNYALFIKRSVTALDGDIHPVQGTPDTGRTADFHETLEAGTIEYLNEGEEPFAFNPNRPGSSFAPFVERMLRAISTTIGISYEVLCRDFGRMNLSSARAMLRECHRNYDRSRTLLNRQLNTPAYNSVITKAVAEGQLQPPAAFLDNPEAFLAVRWVAPAYGFVDPVTDVEGSRKACDANMSTPQQEAARYGQDAYEILQQRAEFFAAAAKLEKQFNLDPGTLTKEAPERVESSSRQIRSDGKTADPPGTGDQAEQDDEQSDDAEAPEDDAEDDTEQPDDESEADDESD
jgi:lambda family phage portal protein